MTKTESFSRGVADAERYRDENGAEEATMPAIAHVFGDIDGWIDEDGLPEGADRDEYRRGALSVFEAPCCPLAHAGHAETCHNRAAYLAQYPLS